MNIRVATQNDISQLTHLKKPQKEHHVKMFHDNQIKRLDEMEKGESIYLVIEDDNLIVAHLLLKLQGIPTEPGNPNMNDLYVLEEKRNLGIGSKLVKEAEKIEEAVKLFSEAEKYETNPVLLERIQELKQSKQVQNVDTKDLKSFFSEHSIIGKKLVSTSEDGDVFVVRLKEFPVEQMPEFAKQKLLGSIKAVLVQEKYKSVRIVDDVSGKELLVVEK